jgi:hypothetical protein
MAAPLEHGRSLEYYRPETVEEDAMLIALILLAILIILVFGLGFIVKTLFWVALILALIWIIAVLVNAIRRR